MRSSCVDSPIESKAVLARNLNEAPVAALGSSEWLAHLYQLLLLSGFLLASVSVARRLGCEDLELTSSRSRSGAHAFYRHLGFEDRCPRSARFVRPLTASSERVREG